MENQQALFSAPTTVNVTVAKKRPREYLTETEIERLMEAARQNRHGHRDATAILLAYRHGRRASEVVGLRWDDFDLTRGRVHVRRSKGGETAVHPIGGKETGALGLLAEDMNDLGAKTMMLQVANDYERIAVRAEQRLQDHKSAG